MALVSQYIIFTSRALNPMGGHGVWESMTLTAPQYWREEMRYICNFIGSIVVGEVGGIQWK